MLVEHREGPHGESVKVRGTLSSNDGDVVLGWALDGHGILIRSEWDLARYLASGQLRAVLPDHALAPADLRCIRRGAISPPRCAPPSISSSCTSRLPADRRVVVAGGGQPAERSAGRIRSAPPAKAAGRLNVGPRLTGLAILRTARRSATRA